MAELQHRTDVSAVGVLRLLQQFRGKPRIEALLSIYLDEFQELEDARYDVFSKTSIDTGEGVQLDGEGEIIGEERQGVDDLSYKPFLRARIRANRSTGHVAEIVNIVLLLLGDTTPAKAREFYPCVIVLEPQVAITISIRRLFLLLDKASTGGTSLRLIYSKVAHDHTIVGGWSQGSLGLTATQKPGYSGVAGIGGGKLAGVFAE